MLLYKYSMNKYDTARNQAESYIFYRKYDRGKLDLMMSVNLDDLFMSVRKDT